MGLDAVELVMDIEVAKVLVPGLVKALKVSDHRVRLQAAKALGNMGRHAKDAIPSLQEMLQDEGLRETAAWALGKIRAERAAEQPAQRMKELDQAAAELESATIKPDRRQDAAIAEIEKLGGKWQVYHTSARTGKGLILYGPRVTDAGLVHLKGLSNLDVRLDRASGFNSRCAGCCFLLPQST